MTQKIILWYVSKNGGFFLKREEEINKVEKKRGKKVQKSWSLSLFLKITKTTTTMMMTMMVVVMMMMMMMTRFTTTTTPPTRPKA